MALGDDLLADRRVERAVNAVEQQRARLESASPRSGSSGSPARTSSPLPVRAAHTSATRSASRRRATKPRSCAEALVEPLRVVDEADQRLLLGDLGEQRQRGEPDQEPVGRRAGAQPEHRRERFALRDGQPVEAVEHGRAELMEAAVGELHLRLDADGRRDVPAVDPVGEVAEQRALAHARLSAQDDHSAATGERVGQEPSSASHSARRPRSFIDASLVEELPCTAIVHRLGFSRPSRVGGGPGGRPGATALRSACETDIARPPYSGAGSLGVPKCTVKSRFHHAMRALRVLL